jgi:uncharacterized protein YjbI with pentapeptide repeats
LSGANLSGADLRGTLLYEVNLSDANFRGASLKKAHFGRSLGISEAAKQDWIRRRAIFDDFGESQLLSRPLN